jgi:tungstate transport system ATP-binding protein
MTDLRRTVTLLHQTPYLGSGTVAANVAYGLSLRGIRGAERHHLVDEALAMVGLAGFSGRIARTLSGGEQRRVALARALAIKPRVLILDEPFAGLDREAAELLEDVISSLPRAGTTVILSTHDARHPRRLGGEIIALEGGRVVEAYGSVIHLVPSLNLVPVSDHRVPDTVAGC